MRAWTEFNHDPAKDKYRVKSGRLKGWDYTSAGWHFVTICTRKRMSFFGEISSSEMHLTPIGKMVAYEWKKTEKVRSYVSLDEWVIMPNHIHGIIFLHPIESDVETSRANSANRHRTSIHQDVLYYQNLKHRDVSTKKPRFIIG